MSKRKKDRKRKSSTPEENKPDQLTENQVLLRERLISERERKKVIAKVRDWLEKCPELSELDPVLSNTETVTVHDPKEL